MTRPASARGDLTELTPPACPVTRHPDDGGDDVPHRTACRALGVRQSWFYKWRANRPPAPRATRRARLTDKIGIIFFGSGGTYRSPQFTVELREAG